MVLVHIEDTLASDSRWQRGHRREDCNLWHFLRFELECGEVWMSAFRRFPIHPAIKTERRKGKCLQNVVRSRDYLFRWPRLAASGITSYHQVCWNHTRLKRPLTAPASRWLDQGTTLPRQAGCPISRMFPSCSLKLRIVTTFSLQICPTDRLL